MSDRPPAAALLHQAGLGEHVDRIPMVDYYLVDMHRPGSPGETERRALYVGRERAQGYIGALVAPAEGGGPGHRDWRYVPQFLKCMWRQHMYVRLGGDVPTVRAPVGQETALVFVLRKALEGTGIEVTGGLYALQGTSAPHERPLVHNTITSHERFLFSCWCVSLLSSSPWFVSFWQRSHRTAV